MYLLQMDTALRGKEVGGDKPLAYLSPRSVRLDYCVLALHSEFIHAKIILRGIFFFRAESDYR